MAPNYDPSAAPYNGHLDYFHPVLLLLAQQLTSDLYWYAP